MVTRDRGRRSVGPARRDTEPTPLSLWPFVIVVATAAGIAFFYFGLYLVRHYSLPIGWDTPRYLFHAHLAAERGLSDIPSSLPPPSKVLLARPDFPVLALSLARILGVSDFRAAAVVPVIALMAMALAAGALVSWSLRGDSLDFATVAVVVGLSPWAIRLVAPETYTDNLVAGALLVAALACTVSFVVTRRGWLPAVLLLGIAALAHTPSFEEVVLALGLVAVAFGASSWRAWRRGTLRPLETVAGSLAAIVAGAAALGGVVLYGFLGAAPDTYRVSRDELAKKFHQDVPLYRFPITAPLAGVGAFGLWSASDGDTEGARGPRRAPLLLLAVLLAWAAVGVAGLVLHGLGRDVPAHRFLAFLLPVPILAGAGLLAIRRAVSGNARSIGIAVVAIGIAGLTLLGYRTYYVTMPNRRGVEWLESNKVRNADTAVSYLDRVGVPATAPVVFVVDDTGPNPLSYVPEMAYIIRSVLPADRVEHAYFYVGDPERYLAGEPTQRATPRTYNVNVQRFWPTIQRLLPRHPLALVLDTFNPAYGRVASGDPAGIAAPGIYVLNGPRPAAPLPAAPLRYTLHGALGGARVALGAFVIVFLAGLGWSIALLWEALRPFEVLALAPAFGIGLPLLGGTLVDVAGLRVGSWPNVAILVVVVAAGWAAAARRLRANAETGSPVERGSGTAAAGDGGPVRTGSTGSGAPG